MTFSRLFLILALILFFVLPSRAQQSAYHQEVFTGPRAGARVHSGSGTGYHQIAWNTSGGPGACLIALDYSEDGMVWYLGSTIPIHDCTSSGTSIIAGPANVEFVRMNMNALSTGSAVRATYTGFQTNPGGPTGSVTSVFGRTGQIQAQSGDYNVAQITGAAPLFSPNFQGSPTAPTPNPGDNSTLVATTAFVTQAIAACGCGGGGGGAGVSSFNGRTGTVVPLASDYSAFFAPIGGGGGGAVSSVFGRIGAIVAQPNDYTYAQVTGAAPLDSPDFTGIPTAITAPLGTNTTQLATTAFVIANAGTSGTSYPGLSSNGTTLTFSGPGGITASQFNSTGTGGFRIDSLTAPLPGSPPASGHSSLVSGPDGWYIAENGGGFNRILSGTGGGTAGVASFNGRTGAVVPQASDYSAFFAPIGGGTTAGVSSFNTRTGAVVPAAGDYTVGDIQGAAPLVSPAFTGTPSAPTPPATDNSTRIANTAWVMTAIAGGGGGGQPLPIAPSPQQPSECAAQNVTTANTLTISGLNILANDTVMVPIVTNVNNTTATVTDNSGSSNYSTLFTRIQTTGNTAIMVTTPASAAHAATSLTITISVNTKFVACVLAYENVTGFGTPVGAGIGSGVATGTVSATTHDNNNIVLAMFGQTVATSMSITTGTPLNIGSSGVPYFATSATAPAIVGLCANNEPISGTPSTCTATFATSASYTAIAVELRSGAVSAGGFAGPKVVAFHKANVIATTTAATDTAFLTCSATDCPAGYYRITWDFLSLGSGCTNGQVIVNVDYFDEFDLNNVYHTGIGSATAIGPGRNHAYWVRMMTVAKPFSSTVGIQLTTTTTPCSAGTGTAQQTVSVERLQ